MLYDGANLIGATTACLKEQLVENENSIENKINKSQINQLKNKHESEK